MWTANGTIDGDDYEITWIDGAVEGSPDVRATLSLHIGRPFLASPTGPERILDLADSASVLTALLTLTGVAEITGDIPLLAPPLPEGMLG